MDLGNQRSIYGLRYGLLDPASTKHGSNSGKTPLGADAAKA